MFEPDRLDPLMTESHCSFGTLLGSWWSCVLAGGSAYSIYLNGSTYRRKAAKTSTTERAVSPRINRGGNLVWVASGAHEPAFEPIEWFGVMASWRQAVPNHLSERLNAMAPSREDIN